MTSRTHQGLVRLRNEDWTHLDVARGFAIVADGMGGLQAGQIASRTAVETAADCLEAAGQIGDETLRTMLSRAHDAVQNKADGLGLLGRMGTTLAVWACNAHSHFCIHVGDSRVYRYREGTIRQLTKDQTLAQRMIDLGIAEPDDEAVERNAHVLTQAVGLPGEFEPELIRIASDEAAPGTRYLICSDGLSDLVAEVRICELMGIANMDDCAGELVKAALDRGGRDNVSVALIEV